jgi:leucyl aminopeptidase
MKFKTVTGNITEIKTGAIIIGYYQDTKQMDDIMGSVDRILNGVISNLIKQGDIKGKSGESTLLYSNGLIPADRIVIAGMGKKKDLNISKISETVAESCRQLRQKGVTSITMVPLGTGINHIKIASATQAVAEGAILGLYRFRRYMTKKENNTEEVKEVKIVVNEKEKKQIEKAIEKGQIIAESANWTRDLVNEPSNFMTPEKMAEAASELVRKFGLNIEVLKEEQIRQEGMGGLLGVSRGSQQPPRFIILKYKGRDPDETDIVLVGKGITFDSGGISIKPSERMGDMKGDMAGGASVLGTLRAIAQLKPKVNVTALVPATENLPSGTAMKPGDVITAMNGKTIEVLNTDAEGRLILADALSYAKKIDAKTIIDVATLTGACQIALGNICTGAFSNNQELIDEIIAAGNEVGERAWQLPMFAEYREQLKSDIADIKNIGTRYGGAITAAKFLEDFVGDIPWVHLDIAGTSDTDKEKGYLVKGASGIPVRTLVNFILLKAK